MKRLVFCFDGTWNRLDAKFPTNVVITAESVVPIASDGSAQMIYYDQGVGTGKWDRFRGGIFGAGLLDNIAHAYRFLIFNFTPGDEIYIFGFSRGAFTARSFAGLLSNCGILRRRDAAKVTEAIEHYRKRENTPAYDEQMMCFRRDYSPQICVSSLEDEWRSKNLPGYVPGQASQLQITYLGVWDTVGALGVPSTFGLLNPLNKKYQFHDTRLSSLAKSARHAVAIDERRKDFQPTLWDNLQELNKQTGHLTSADDAPYQQKWFPGTHGSVGGGGDRRGLSDQALDWVMDGARHVGLQLDSSQRSRIFELAPNYVEFLNNSEDPGMMYRAMNFFAAADRQPGPSQLFEVSISARRRWMESPTNLRDGTQYRPKTLAGVANALSALDPAALGVGMSKGSEAADGKYVMYEVKQGDTLRGLAEHFYGDANASRRIFTANLNKLESEDRIYVGVSLRIPIDGAS
jgi:uncharacterized protein (DUF2235 family)